MNESVDSRKCQTVLDNAPTLIISADRNGIVLFSNRDAFGHTREDMPGNTIYEFVPKPHREGLSVVVNEAIRTKTAQSFVFDDSSSGVRNWIRLRIGPVISESEVESIVMISNVITDQKKAEKELMDSEIKLRSIFNSTLEGIILSDETGDIVEWNKAQEDIFGIRKEEALGRKLWDVQYSMLPEERRTPEAYSGFVESIQKYFETGDAPWLHHVVEATITLANGETGVIQQFAAPIKTSKGYALCAFIHDITERRRAERKRIESEKRYKALFDETNDGVAILDLDGTHLDFNEKTAELLGYTREDLIGKSIDMTVVEDQQEEAKKRLKQLLAGEKLPIYERTLKRKDGSEIPVEINISLVRDEEENPLHLQSIMRDISSRRQSEIELKESEQKWRLLAEESIQGIAILQDQNMVYANPAYANIVGRSVEELNNLDSEGVWSIIHPDDREGRKAGIRRYAETKELAQSSVFRIVRPDGETRWIDGGISIIDFGGKPAMQRTAIDITNRMLAEKAVAAERDRAEMYLQMAGVIFLALDIDGDVTLINRKGTEVLGYSSDELLGKPWFDLIPEEFRHEGKGNFNKIIQGELEQIEYIEREVITRSGEKKLIAWHSSVLKDSEGKITGVISSGEDITEKRAAQMELKASQEMLQLVMNNIPHHVFWKDNSSIYLGCNDSFAEVYISGTPQDVIGQSDYDLHINSEEAERFRNADRLAIESEEKRYDEIERTLLPNGDEAWFRTVKVPLHDSNGNEIGILGTLEDVTEKRNAELELIERERKIRTLMHSMKDLVFVFDENNVYREFYVQDVEDLYMPASEFIGQNIKDVLPHEVSIPFADCMDKVRQSGISEPFDYLLADESGDRWYSASISPHEDGRGIVTVIREITARVVAARELEKAYRIINMSPAVAFLWRNDENWPVEYVSGNVRDLLGYSAGEFMSESVLYSKVVHPDDLVRVADEVQGFSADSLCESFVHEPYRIVRKDGEVRWVTDDTVIRRNEKGEITHYQGVVTDITNRVLMMDALIESESKYRSIIEQSLMGLLIIDSEDRMVRLANPLIANYIGRSIDDLLSMSMEELIQIIDPIDLEPATRFLEKCIRGEDPEQIVARIYRHSGEKIWLRLDGNRVTFEGRNAVQLSVVDITARMEALESLQKERASFRAIAEGAV
ncbi:MAG: PAS domain S-box protein, partial [Candidatus Thorarchaeota archaeon]|nr:PAS domain S-box protein [Candidatus Thorarchaeota archaeon]